MPNPVNMLVSDDADESVTASALVASRMGIAPDVAFPRRNSVRNVKFERASIVVSPPIASVEPTLPIDTKSEFTANGTPRHKLVSRGISAVALIAWVFLMITVVARSGTALEIISITLLPLIAHIASLYLIASNSASDAKG